MQQQRQALRAKLFADGNGRRHGIGSAHRRSLIKRHRLSLFPYQGGALSFLVPALCRAPEVARLVQIGWWAWSRAHAHQMVHLATSCQPSPLHLLPDVIKKPAGTLGVWVVDVAVEMDAG